MTHQLVIPHATYSPWWSDEAFQDVLHEVLPATMVDPYRLYELWSLVAQLADLDGDILEVGVWRGGSGCLMAARAQREGIELTTYLCDTFEGVVKVGEHDTVYQGGEWANTDAARVEDLARRMGLGNVRVVKGIFPDESGDLVPATKLRLCHIDVDVYESARGVVDWAWERLVPGGVIVFDDYGFSSCEGLTRFVNETAARADLLFVHNVNGHAILVKR